MVWETILHLVTGWVDAAEAFLTSEWDATKVLQSIAACFTIGAGALGILQTLRFAEKRLYRRLVECLNKEEVRLDGSRKQLVAALRKTVPGKPKIEPIFSNRQLSLALRQMRWGRLNKAEISLQAALALADEKVALAAERSDVHRRQKLSAHLLLGAIAEFSKESSDCT